MWNIPLQLGIWWKFLKIYFSCTVQLCMQICHKPFPNHEGHFRLIYSIFYWKYSCVKYYHCLWAQKLWYLVEILENLLFHVLSNYACKFAINLFPITWGPFQNVNLLYFLLKIQISNGCNVLNIAGNPIKDIIVNLSFLSSGSKVMQNIPCQAGYLVEILENLLFHVLSNYACKFAINLFPITWGPFQNVNLLYFLLKIQISNGCNVLNIAGNPIKEITVNLSFLSSGSKVVENIPCLGWVSGGNFGKPTFSCTVQLCLQICHKPFPPSHEGHFKMLIYSIFY